MIPRAVKMRQSGMKIMSSVRPTQKASSENKNLLHCPYTYLLECSDAKMDKVTGTKKMRKNG
jgi:hypothetical protein